MGIKICMVLISYFSFVIWIAYGNFRYHTQSDSLPQNLCYGKEKIARLQLYVQDVKAGPNTTVWEVARSNITSKSDTNFGLVNVMDNKITAGPDFNSEEVGRAQAIIAFSGLQETAVTMNFNFYLTRGKYGGSTLTVLGRHPLYEVNRELPVVGGTGIFRMARGYAISNTYSSGEMYNVLEYTFYVYYMEHGPSLDLVEKE